MPFESSFSEPEEQVQQTGDAAITALHQLAERMAKLASWHLDTKSDPDKAYQWLKAREEVIAMRHVLYRMAVDGGLAVDEH